MTMNRKKENRDEIAVLGVPFDKNSSFLRGQALAPLAIKKALFIESTNMWTENAIDLGLMSGWQMLNNLEFSDSKTCFEQIEGRIKELLKKKKRVISLGGDHSITYPVIRAYSKKYNSLSILHFDAHPDLYDTLDNNPYSHACLFARIMEENLIKRLVQVGIRTLNNHQREQAERFGVEMIEMKNIKNADKIVFDEPVYLSFDMDCLDPAFAPGVSHHEPGGMSTRDVLRIIQNFKGNLVGADIVEYNPERDLQGITGMAAVKLLKEILGRMLEQKQTIKR